MLFQFAGSSVAISKEDAERMLNALQNKEKNLREKMEKEQQNQNYKTEKDW